MKTPIFQFVKEYAQRNGVRLHMPGHKGASFLGFEGHDITEIDGADSLYQADGIIRHSEENAGRIFGCNTFYSTEGSSQCIRAMLYLALLDKRSPDRKPLIVAGRNAHKTFLSAAALLDFEIDWLCPADHSYLSCGINASDLEQYFTTAERPPVAVYLTSPDYLGNMLDIQSLAEVCHRHHTLLLVDNAHGAYLKFLPNSRHPMDLGADLCCDSAHKTLPVLTGGAYLHISKAAPELFAAQAKRALALFGSTSPSYLILQSLDLANSYLCDHSARLSDFLPKLNTLKQALSQQGYTFIGDEPLKLTIESKPYGYEGIALATLLSKQGIFCEFCDPDFVVMMFTPEIGDDQLRHIYKALTAIPQKAAIDRPPPKCKLPLRKCSVREAVFSSNETLPVSDCLHRVLAADGVGCPPAVPIVVCGEEIDADAIACFRYYGIETCTVVKNVK